MMYCNQVHPCTLHKPNTCTSGLSNTNADPKHDSKGSKPQEHKVGMVGEGARGVVTVDNHMCLMGWDMMGTKQSMMTRMKNHTHSICTILHVHKVRGGDMFV